LIFKKFQNRIRESIRLNITLFSKVGIQGFVLLVIAFGLGSTSFAVQTESGKHVVRDGLIVVTGISNSQASQVKVWLKSADRNSLPPLAGETSVVEKEIRFKPRFPFGSKAYVFVVMENDKVTYEGELDLTTTTKPATIEKIFPSSETLAENTLRFYVQFSAPMQKGDIYKHLKIREVGGEDVELPFLEIDQEFWSRDSLRLTLLLDPGRVKRGLKPREDMGPIFEKGKIYELIVSGMWADAEGNVLGEDFVKRYRIGGEDHQLPKPDQWKITSPAAGTKNSLAIGFASQLDHAMLHRSIQIVGPAGSNVDGEIAVTKNESVWSFLPSELWSEGTYKVLVDDRLEDACGNSVAKQFDVDVFEPSESDGSISSKTVELEFSIEK